MSKVWTESEIYNLIKTNDKFLIRCLLKMKDLDDEFEVFKYNSFLVGLYDFYKVNWRLTSKQLNAFRDMINNSDGIYLITKIANKKKIYENDIFARDFKPKTIYHLLKQLDYKFDNDNYIYRNDYDYYDDSEFPY